MSMFKNPPVPAEKVVQTTDLQFVNQTQINNINNISNIQQEITNISQIVNQTTKISLTNEYLTILESKFSLSYIPLSNKVIYDMLIIYEEIEGDMLIHAELINDFTIENTTITLNTSFYNGLKVLVSYMYEEPING